MNLFLGIDFGTSGVRAVVIDTNGSIYTQVSDRFPVTPTIPWPQIWQQALFQVLQQIPAEQRAAIRRLAIDGTSSTVLLCDRQGQPLTEPLFYNDGRAISVLDQVKAIAPADHTVCSATSSLAKLLWWQTHPNFSQACYLLHQADWLAFLLHSQLGISDYHNALKLGYDVGTLGYPAWLTALPIASLLPQVVEPGTAIALVQPQICDRWGFPADCQVCAGTTDSIAAFLASGATVPGEAVTSLGSTLVVKLLSKTRVDASAYGIYSHRFGDLWLVGGASNTGGAVLQKFFSQDQLIELSAQIDPTAATALDYYPLLQSGERFPINDPNLAPRLDPRPNSPVAFLQGLLTGMARIEAQGYCLLQTLGATALTQVYTAGGGANNPTWTALRAQQLQVPVLVSSQTEAAYGTARLARQGLGSSAHPSASD